MTVNPPPAPAGPAAYCGACARSGVGACDDYPDCPGGTGKVTTASTRSAPNPRQRTWDPLVTDVYFAVPVGATIGPRFPAWAAAVEHARGTITEHRYPGQVIRPDTPDYHPRRHIQDGPVLVVRTRAFVHMRVTQPVQDRPGSAVRSGVDTVAATWEVFADGTVEARDSA